MPYTPISPLPAVPNRSSAPETFSDDVDTFLSALPVLQEQINNSSAYIDLVAASVDADKTASATSASAAASSATASAGSASIAVTAVNFKGAYSGLSGALNVPASTYHNGQYWQLLQNTTNVTLDVPGVSSKWALAVNSSGRTVVAGPVTLSYPGRFLVTNSGTITLPTPVGVNAGVSYNIAKVSGVTPTIETVADGFKWRDGLDNQISLTISAVDIIAYNDKYEV